MGLLAPGRAHLSARSFAPLTAAAGVAFGSTSGFPRLPSHGHQGFGRYARGGIWTSNGRASRAVTQRHLGCISSLTATNKRMVHQ